GTDRIAEVAMKIPAEIYINVQGDQPFTDPRDLDAVVAPMLSDPSIEMATLATPIADLEEFRNPTKVKVVCDAFGNALYFSRSPIPHARDLEGVPPGALRHIGIYAYRREFLMRFASMPQGKLEQLEKLEQLRALENGYLIRVVASVSPSLEIDTAEDLVRARRSQMGNQ
ncbi:MAG TPA: 3-deoxy-manno-octulosonate cytidylyltransferase, partial [Candidatus Binataceae bacterium]|nr:3-deoxy-manno-octulosonate cytidylyltransferase [Candidatus Binataceae bacterium]